MLAEPVGVAADVPDLVVHVVHVPAVTLDAAADFVELAELRTEDVDDRDTLAVTEGEEELLKDTVALADPEPVADVEDDLLPRPDTDPVTDAVLERDTVIEAVPVIVPNGERDATAVKVVDGVILLLADPVLEGVCDLVNRPEEDMLGDAEDERLGAAVFDAAEEAVDDLLVEAEPDADRDI